MVRKITEAGVVFILSAIIFFLFFSWVIPNALTHLNTYFFSTTHDGIKNYYTYLYYLKYDHGFHFSGMAYPHGDLITFTDNQPLLVLTLKWLNATGIPANANAVAIFNTLLLLSFPLCTLLLYYILKQFKVTPWFAFIIALTITFINPQVERLAGHYALAYSFVIPLFWLMDIRMNKSAKPIRWTFFIVIVTLLLTFLHVYYLAVAMLFFLFAGIGHFLAQGANKNTIKRIAWMYIPASILPMALFKVFMFVVDSVPDRVAFPFGFLFYRSSYRALFFSDKSPFETIVPKFIQVGKLDFEGHAYLGFFALIFSVWTLYQVIKKSIQAKKFSFNQINLTEQRLFDSYIVLGMLALMLGAAFPFYMPPFDVVIEWITPLAQFRSPGRFAWIFFFIFSVYMYVWAYQRFSTKPLKWILIVLISVSLFEGVIIARNQLTELNKVTLGDRFFETNELAAYEKMQLNKQHYQAIIAFPFYTIGNEKGGFAGTNTSIFESMKCSYQTGLPLVNYMMSRTGVQVGLEIAAITGNPVLEKTYFNGVDSNKPFLLMISDSGLTEFEKSWLSYATPLMQVNGVAYYSISPKDIKRMQAEAVQAVYAQSWLAIPGQTHVLGTDTNPSFWFFSPLAETSYLFSKQEDQLTQNGRVTLFDAAINTTDSLLVSFWGRASTKVYGFPVIMFTEYDASGKEVFHYNSHTSTQMEFYASCKRVEYAFKLHQVGNRVKIETSGKKYQVANFCIQPLHSERLFRVKEQWFWNNYPIDSLKR